MDLFDRKPSELGERQAPLADRMRPNTLGEFFGQQDLVGEGKLLRRLIESDQFLR